MPPYQALVPAKRKSNDEHDFPNKRVEGPFEAYWMVQWRNPQTKKHTTWEGDGVVKIYGSRATLYNIDSHQIGSGKVEPPYEEGKVYEKGFDKKPIMLEREIPRSEFYSGQCFGQSSAPAAMTAEPPSSVTHTSATKPFVTPKLSSSTTSYKHPEKRYTPLQPSSVANSPPRSQFADNIKVKQEDSCWTVNWRKTGHPNKNRSWDGDAFVTFKGNKVTLISEKGKTLGTMTSKGAPLLSGTRLFIANLEVQLDNRIPASQIPGYSGPDIPAAEDASMSVDSPAAASAAPKKFVAPTSFYASAPVKPKTAGPLHDPSAEGAVVMKAPTKEHLRRFNKKDLPVVPVVIDPILARKLRPHQVEGVKFLYECVMGMGKHEGQGCILADDMGLGKTLQTITLVWTLLKQNPYANVGPVLHKVLIVCPVSLVSNWDAEFRKWLGRDRVGVAVCNKDKVDNVVAQFMNSKRCDVLIIGYERLRTVIDKLALCVPPVGMIICDEGHRLKSANNKTTKMFARLKTPRRIILSGTPIQNDLSEFHAMADFCNPGLLDDYPTFRRVYETPILKCRAPDSTAKERELGEARSEQLGTISKSFVLRRESTILKNFLPPKHEYVVFIKPTTLQLNIFNKILNPDRHSLDDLTQGSTAESLAMITMLTKISNSPILLRAAAEKDQQKGSSGGSTYRSAAVKEALALLPEGARIEDMNLSGKLRALAKLLKTIKQTTDEKCVIVSHYVSSLNILELYLQKKNYSYFRLDGQTQASKRLEFVNNFNKSSQKDGFVFLLSSKAGGVGLNLIGASRLVLIDTDWNPSHDAQAMARCHRDGQKRPVHIYRFMTAGAIDEKIFQRQVTKIGLSNSLIGSGSDSSKTDGFTRKELRDIFRIHPETACNTHDLLECPCSTSGDASMESSPTAEKSEDEEDLKPSFRVASDVKPKHIHKMDKEYLQKKKEGLAALGEWKHINCLSPSSKDEIEDDMLRKLLHWKDEDPEAEPKKKMSLLEATDISNLENVKELNVGDLSGGTVTFVLQKSKISEEKEEEEEEA